MQTDSDLPRQGERRSPASRAAAPASSPASSPIRRTASGRQRARNVINFIERLTIPSGRGRGRPFRLDVWEKRFIRDIYEMEQDGRRVVRRAILSIARKNGKALALDTLLPTPTGWITMGDVCEGDVLYDETGAPCRVTFATPVQFGRRCFRVHFADGTSIIADADHQWTVRSRSRHEHKLTMTTEQMSGDVVLRHSRADRVERNYSVDVAAAVRGRHRSLPVPPYTLGVWLGDGCASGARIVSTERDQSILEEIAAEGVPVRRQRDGKTCTYWSLSDGIRDRTKPCVQKALRNLGVLNEKHIPATYQRAEIAQRMALLQGLMDTDGYVSQAGQCEFVSVSERLARDVVELIRGLGFKATLTTDRARLNGLDCGPRYRIQFWSYANRPVFRLTRKCARLKPPRDHTRNASNYITAIEPTESVPVRCIQVDSPSSLFLAGEGFTPTHNTALIACIALAHLIGPEAITNGEIYSAANDHDQAAIVYKFAKQIVELEPELRAEIQIIPSTKTMIARRKNSVYRAISAEATTKHGYMPAVVIYDELAQAKNRNLYDVLDTSFGATEEPLFIVISTQSNDPEHVLSKLIDDGLAEVDPSIICHLYAADENCDLEDERQWLKANPALGKWRDREDLAAAARKAKRLPAEEPKFRNLFLNQRVSPTASLISRAEWAGCAGPVVFSPGEELYLGLDLSSVVDLTALVAGSVSDPTRIKAWFWKPRDLLQDHATRDFGPGNRRYEEWMNAGHLLTSPGRSIDPAVVAAFIAELTKTYKIRGLAYDRWRINDLMREFDRIGFQTYEDASFKPDDGQPKSWRETQRNNKDGLRIVPWGQGYRDMGPAIDALDHAVIERTIVHPNNPVLTWNMANAVAIMDPAGNRKIDKEQARWRIDGAVALAMMCGLKARDRLGTKPIDIAALIG